MLIARDRASGRGGAGVEPSFVMFQLIATVLRHALRRRAACARISRSTRRACSQRSQTHAPALIFLAYPNNPTGNLFDARRDRARARAPRRALVVIDEAYHAFAGATYMRPARRHPNLLVMRTVSKLGLAGLRLGLLAGPAEWLDAGRQGALAVQRRRADPARRRSKMLRASRRARRAGGRDQSRARAARSTSCSGMPGVTRFPSEANSSCSAYRDAERVFNGLKQRGVLVRNLHGAHPALDELPAGHRRHAGRERPISHGAARDPRSSNRLPITRTRALSANMPSAGRSHPQHQETQIRVKLDLDGTRHGAARHRHAVPRPHARPGRAPRHARPRDRGARATCTSTRTTRSRTSASRSARRSRKAIGDKKGVRRYGHAYVPLDEALSRVVVDFSGRPGLEFHVEFTRALHRRVRRGPGARVLPGLRQPRAGDAAHRQPARRQRAPPVRDGVQGVRARAAHGGRTRSARCRARAFDQRSL